MLLRLAWRNLWRNKRRSAIVLTSIVVGYAALVFLDGMSTGMIHQMLENRIGVYTTHIQVHRKGFPDSRNIDDRIREPGEVSSILEGYPGVESFSGRVLTFGMLNSTSGSAGVTIVGIDPAKEREVTLISSLVRSGDYLSGSRREILLSSRLADKLDVGLGDKIVGMASGLEGEIGSELFRVTGLYSTYLSRFDETHAYVHRADAAEMLSTEDDLMEFAVILSEPGSVDRVKAGLAGKLGEDHLVSTYRELLPLLVAQVDIYREMMMVVYLIVSLAIVLGIVNTMLMAVYERIQEFGVLFAVGMKRHRVFSMVLLEAFSLGVLGTLIGIGVGAAVTAPFMETGIDLSMFEQSLKAFGTGAVIRPELTLRALFSASMVVPLVSAAGAVYPAFKAMSLRPVEAIRFI